MPPVLPTADEYADLVPTPDSPVWQYASDIRMGNVSGYALMLQVAHPTVGAGVAEHSNFREDPFGRLLRTLDYVNGTIYGGPELAGEIGVRVRNMHKTIKGTKSDGSRYSALEPDAFAWVHATLAHSIFEGHRVFVAPMSDHEKQAFWRQWMDVGRLVGVRYRDLPDTAADFEEYFDSVVDERLEWTPAIPQVLDTLAGSPPPNVPGMRPGLWRLLRAPMGYQVRVATIGLMPDRLRRRLELPFSPRERRAYKGMAAASRAAGPLVRGPLREFGPNYVRWRRQALARGDVAATGSAPAGQPVAAA